MRSKVRTALICVIIGALLGGVGYSVWKDLQPAEDEEEWSFSLFNSRKETIHVWYDDESMTDYINSAAVIYGDENDVRVIPTLVTDSEYLEAINQASISTDNVPDVYLLGNDSLEKAYLAGLASEIDDHMEIVNTNYFPQVALNAVTYKDRLIAYPLYFESSVLLYNETYLKEWALQQGQGENNPVPQTIEELLNLANTFDPPETVEGIFKWDVSDIFYNYYFVGNYLKVGGETGDQESVLDIANQETIDCLEIYKSLNEFFYIESDTVSYESVLQDFIDGKLVFTIASTDAAARLEAAKEDGTFPYDYGAVTIPDLNDKLQGRSLSVTGTVVVNGYSAHKELANKFAAYLAGEYAGNLYERAGKCPVNHNVIHEEYLLDVFYEEYKESISLPKMVETSNYWMQLEVLFAKVWNDGDIAQVLTELAQQMETQIKGRTN